MPPEGRLNHEAFVSLHTTKDNSLKKRKKKNNIENPFSPLSNPLISMVLAHIQWIFLSANEFPPGHSMDLPFSQAVEAFARAGPPPGLAAQARARKCFDGMGKGQIH